MAGSKDAQRSSLLLASVSLSACTLLPRHNHSSSLLGKWSMSHSELPRRVFPDHCFGWLYVLTPKVARHTSKLARHTGHLNCRAFAVSV